MNWLRKLASTRCLMILVCALPCVLVIRSWKSWKQIVSADRLVIWNEPLNTNVVVVVNTSHSNDIATTANTTNNNNNPFEMVPRPKRHNGTLFRCGFGTGRLIRLLFDDFLADDDIRIHPDDDSMVPRFTKKNITNPNDIIYFGSITGPCDGISKEWLNQHFPGKVLFQNGESHSDGRGPNSYMISAEATSERNTHVPFVSVVLLGQVPRSMWPIVMWNDAPRPRNNGTHFLVYATSNCVDFRNKVALALSRIGLIHHGACRPYDDHAASNFTPLADDASGFEWSVNFYVFSKFRFCLVMENRQHPGYVTEKILNAFLGGCIPIWYGTTDVWNIFHRDAFLYVDALQEESIQALVDRVQYLEQNTTAYDEMFHHPILAHDNATVEQYFSLDDSIGHGHLKHQVRLMMGLEDEYYTQIG